MTCPKCGYVSYPGLSQCKRCGYPFPASELKEASATTLSAAPPQEATRRSPPPLQASPPALAAEDVATHLPEIQSEPPPDTEQSAPEWRDELAGKLEDHRRKRSRLRGQFDPNSSLDFEFGEPLSETPGQHVDAELSGPGHGGIRLDSPLGPAQGNSASHDPLALEKPVETMRVLSSAAVEAGESQLGEEDAFAQPVEIILESPAAAARAGLHRTPGGLRVAPLSKRFLAGTIDALILLTGGGLFALIFWIVGGRVTLNALNLAVFGSIATVFVLTYFGMFCALSSSTPGMLWMNLELRSVAGGHPSLSESFWRAFGYLVSGASLMLGFAWALADSDHLTWHDHMSGTYITPFER